MAGFNTVDKRGKSQRVAVASGPMRTTSVRPTDFTHEGAPGFQRDARTELFLRVTTMYVGENAFYEKKNESADRLRLLVGQLAVDSEDWVWLKSFIRWLRGDGNIRSAGILLAAEAVHARLAAGLHGDGNREVIDSVLQRADEPMEIVAYWASRWGVVRDDGSVQVKLPMPVKRGIGDAVTRLFTERNFLRYDGNKPVRMGDVLELAHPELMPPKWMLDKLPADEAEELTEADREAILEVGDWKAKNADLRRWMITSRHSRDEEPPMSLNAVRLRYELSRLDPSVRHALARIALNNPNSTTRQQILDAAAGQWEWVLPWLGEKHDGPMLSKAEQWQLVLPGMGYMAKLRNLRGFDEAGIPDDVAAQVAAELADPNRVAKSRQLPYRFYAAQKEAPSQRWGHALDIALTLSLQNVPVLDGQTLVLVDTSGSMGQQKSSKSTMRVVDSAALFGCALKMRNHGGVDLWGFADGQFEVTEIPKAMSLLRAIEAFASRIGSVGHGTQIAEAVRQTIRSHHRRVIILTDMQTFPDRGSNRYGWGWSGVGDVDAAAPANVPIYAWNVAGYTNTAMAIVPGNNRYELGGLTDHTFKLIPQLEAGVNGTWPWEVK